MDRDELDVGSEYATDEEQVRRVRLISDTGVDVSETAGGTPVDAYDGRTVKVSGTRKARRTGSHLLFDVLDNDTGDLTDETVALEPSVLAGPWVEDWDTDPEPEPLIPEAEAEEEEDTEAEAVKAEPVKADEESPAEPPPAPEPTDPDALSSRISALLPDSDATVTDAGDGSVSLSADTLLALVELGQRAKFGTL